MDLTHDDVLSILKLIDESNFGELHLQLGALSLHVRKGDASTARVPERVTAVAAPAPSAPAPALASAPAFADIPAGLHAVRAPLLGTLYRAKAPGEPPFVEAGSRVEADDVLCLVETMKLFNSIAAGIPGTVERFLAENGEVVQRDQPIALIRPT